MLSGLYHSGSGCGNPVDTATAEPYKIVAVHDWFFSNFNRNLLLRTDLSRLHLS